MKLLVASAGALSTNLAGFLRKHGFVAGLVLSAITSVIWIAVAFQDLRLSDPILDFDAADILVHGDPHSPDLARRHFRAGWMLQIAISQFFLGYSPAAYYAPPIVFSLLIICGLYLLVSRFAPWPVALGGAVVLATQADFAIRGTVPLSDSAMVAWFLLGAVCAVVSIRAQSGLAPSLRTVTAVFAGLFLWLGWWTKLSILPLLACIPAIWFLFPRDRYSSIAVATIAMIFLTLIGFELVLNLSILNDAFLPYRPVLNSFTEAWSRRVLALRQESNGAYTWMELALRYPAAVAATPRRLLFLFAAVFGIVVAAWLREPASIWLSACVLLPWLVTTFAVNSLDPLVPVLRTNLRYITGPLIIAIALAACSFHAAVAHVLKLGHRLAGRSLVLGACILVLASVLYQSSILASRAQPDLTASGKPCGASTPPFVELARLAEHGIVKGRYPVTRIVSDRYSKPAIRMYLKPDSPVQLVMHPLGGSPDAVAIRPGDLVHVNRERLAFDARIFAQRKKFGVPTPESATGVARFEVPGNWVSVWPSQLRGYSRRCSYPGHSLYYHPLGAAPRP